MALCLECGIDPGYTGRHMAFCVHADGSIPEIPEDYSYKMSESLLNAMCDRALMMVKGSRQIPEDKYTMSLIDIGIVSGVFSAMCILGEQGFLDESALAEYLDLKDVE